MKDHIDWVATARLNLKGLKPVNTSGRTPKKIVADAEATWLKPYLIVPDDVMPAIVATNEEHLDVCRCNECFQRKLDELVSSTEINLDSMAKSVTLE